MDFIFRAAEEFLKKHKRLNRYRRVFAILAAVVVFATTYELILPAITMDRRRAAAMPGVEAGVAENTVWDSASSTESLAQDSAAAADGTWTDDGSWANDGAWTDDGTGTWTGQDTATSTGTDASADSQATSGQAADGTITENTAIDAGSFDTDSSGTDAFNTDGTTDSAAGTDTFGGTETSGEAWNPENSDSQTGTDTTASDSSANNSAEDLNAGASDNGDSNNAELNPETLNADQTASGENGTDPFADITDGSTDADGNGTAVNEDTAAANDADAVNGGNGASDHETGMVADGTDNAFSDGKTAGTAADTATAAGTAGTNGEELADAAATDTATASALTAEGEWVYPASLTFQAQDKSYTITVTFDETAAIPTDTRLEVTEILPGLIYEDENGDQVYPEYDTYLGKTVEVMDQKGYLEENNLADTRFFDITFRDSAGTVIEPLAPVAVGVRYQETLSAEDTVDTVAIHFEEKKNRETGDRENNTELTDTKTQIIPADTETKKDDSGNEKIEEIAFDAEAFSVYAIATTAPGTPVSMTVGSTETITPAYASGVTGSAYTSYEWKSGKSSVASIQSGASSSSAVIKANKAGTATITLDYAYGKNAKKATTGKAVFAVTVTEADDPDNPGGGSGDDPAGTFTEADCTAQSGSLSDGISGGMTVTVKETGKLKKISDYHVVVEDASEAYADDADMLRAYHIYLADQTGEEVTDLDQNLKNGQNLNLRVTLTYDQDQDWFDQAKDIKHYGRDSGEQTISGITFGKDKKTISFNVRGFSDFVIKSGSTVTTGEGTQITTQEGSILDGKTFNDANEWQIVAEPYIDNSGEQKTSFGNDSYRAVRVQKNVIPTGVENEFWIYLSIDTKGLFDLFFKYATYHATTSHNNHDPGALDTVIDKMTGNKKVYVTGDNTNTNYSNHQYFRVIAHDKHTVLADNIELWWSQANQVTFYMELSSGKYLLTGVNVKSIGTGNAKKVDVVLTEEAEAELYRDIMSVFSLDEVTDVMGKNIELIENSFIGDYEELPDYDAETRTLTWIPLKKVSANTTEETIEGSSIKALWARNIAELIYKVRLDVTEDSFFSCANNIDSVVLDKESYPTNDYATLKYKLKNDSRTYSATFQKPYVRGLLYDIKVKKVDENGNPLQNAKFSLTGTSANTGVNIAQAAASDVTEEQLTSDSNGFVTITELPWGTYTLTETAPPPGYRGDSTAHTAELCYTTNSSNLSGSSIDASRMMQTSWNDNLVIENRKNVITVTKAVETINELPRDLVDHTIYIALKDTRTDEYVKDGSGNILYKTITIENGVPNPSSVSFGAEKNEFIDGNTTYDVMELSEVNGTTATVLHVGDKFTSGDETIQIASITGTANGASSNDADLTDSNTATVDFTNTYSYETNIDFVVNKKWRTNGEEILPPDGTTVTFTLYRSIGDGPPETTNRTVTLDGRIDENGETAAWKATFSNLDVYDAKHNRFVYKVKETDIPDEYLPYLTDSAADPMGDDDYLTLNGGSIWNKQKTTSITVKKEDDQEHFLPGAKFKLARLWTDSAGVEHETQIGEEFTFTSNDERGITHSGLISGTYRLTEVSAPAGYIIKDRSVMFTVDATGSGSVISWTGEKPETVKDLTQTNQADDTVTVINTPGGELPHTGGSGFISPQTLCGIMAMAFVLATAVMYSFSGRRGERRYK